LVDRSTTSTSPGRFPCNSSMYTVVSSSSLGMGPALATKGSSDLFLGRRLVWRSAALSCRKIGHNVVLELKIEVRGDSRPLRKQPLRIVIVHRKIGQSRLQQLGIGYDAGFPLGLFN
jgi:hypothetical protein